MKTMTKIIFIFFVIVLILHGTAALLTYLTISSGRYVEGNPTAAELQTNYGLTNGLTLTFFEGTIMSTAPLVIYLTMAKFANSSSLQPSEKIKLMKILKYFSFPLALAVLIYLNLVAGVDVTHDLAILLSKGKINLWSF